MKKILITEERLRKAALGDDRVLCWRRLGSPDNVADALRKALKGGEQNFCEILLEKFIPTHRMAVELAVYAAGLVSAADRPTLRLAKTWLEDPSEENADLCLAAAEDAFPDATSEAASQAWAAWAASAEWAGGAGASGAVECAARAAFKRGGTKAEMKIWSLVIDKLESLCSQEEEKTA